MNFERSEIAGGPMPPATMKVWDPFVRIFHWSLVVLFVVAFLTGDEIEWLHLTAGYAIAALVALRIAWGFVGPRHARFTNFVKGPRAVAEFLKQSVRLQAPRVVGHNPAGGWMIVALLVMLAGLCIAGTLMTTDAYWGSKALEEIHEALANVTLALIGLHVFGVIVASVEHGENLVKAMLTGRKRS
ncbi:MAG: cytochrome b/b6 domain-containing protein [Hyphomicrobiaceae bacterium]